MKIGIQRVGPYGVLVDNAWVGFDKFSKLKPEMFVAGAEYEAEMKEYKGKQYLTKATAIVSATSPVTSPAKPEAKPVFKKTFAAKADTAMSKDEWKAKDRSQLVGGRSHDAAALTVIALQLGLNAEDVLKVHRELLDGLLKQSDEVK